MPRWKGCPRAVISSAQTKIPALPRAFMWRHSTSMMKIWYMRFVRISPVGLPEQMIIPSFTVQVEGAVLTLTQPSRLLPLKRD